MVGDIARRTSNEPRQSRRVHRLREQAQNLGARRPDEGAERRIVATSRGEERGDTAGGIEDLRWPRLIEGGGGVGPDKRRGPQLQALAANRSRQFETVAAAAHGLLVAREAWRQTGEERREPAPLQGSRPVKNVPLENIANARPRGGNQRLPDNCEQIGEPGSRVGQAQPLLDRRIEGAGLGEGPLDLPSHPALRRGSTVLGFALDCAQHRRRRRGEEVGEVRARPQDGKQRPKITLARKATPREIVATQPSRGRTLRKRVRHRHRPRQEHYFAERGNHEAITPGVMERQDERENLQSAPHRSRTARPSKILSERYYRMRPALLQARECAAERLGP